MHVHLQITRGKLWLFTAASVTAVICAVAAQMTSASAGGPKQPAVAFLDPVGVTRGQVARLSFFNATGEPLPVLMVIADSNGGVLGSQDLVVRPGAGRSFDAPIAVDDIRADQYGRIQIVGTVTLMSQSGANSAPPCSLSLEVFEPATGQTINRTGDRAFFVDETGVIR